MKLKILQLVKKIPKSVFLGVLDALLPNIKDSIKEKESAFVGEKGKLQIDYTRLLAAFVAFLLIVLSIFDVITFQDVIKALDQWNLLLQ